MKKYQEASDEKERQNLRDDRVDSFSRTGGRHRGLRHDVRFDETKKLVDETEGVFEGTNKDAKYKSYTLSFNASYSITYKTETGQEVSDVIPKA